MSSKRVHYERGTKGGSHSQRSSRDSGIGSASDRASLGTGVDDTAFSYQETQNQRRNIDALQEALDAAYATIKQLESSNKKLSDSLADSNKENRQLKKEKGGLLDKVEELLVDLKEERKANDRLRRETSPRSGTRTTPPRVEAPRHRSDTSSSGRRASVVYDMPPLAPQPPPNPFAPLNTRLPPVTFTQSPSVTYAPTTMSYTAPVYAPISPPSVRSHYSSSSSSSSHTKNDGKYHLQPL
ncbi:uncharacterized protein LY89DRAFT_727721 [Mollisia scopiformis]|uniref:Uncharacterized protein n=1 Tax=Mollisia scopiformis TaxID=149040 RepID=A0A194XTB0_MOLSC|nr:uncharacterized protein LY89DRAFT_727721 [Mollisia scopiformis]KUJ22932.1 hypothetical protein LY89DRAFT_727721 [Mollisia scopiformis]